MEGVRKKLKEGALLGFKRLLSGLMMQPNPPIFKSAMQLNILMIWRNDADGCGLKVPVKKRTEML